MAQGWSGKTWSAFSSNRGTKGAAAAFLSHTGGTREVETANSAVVSGTETQDVSEEEGSIFNLFSLFD